MTDERSLVTFEEERDTAAQLYSHKHDIQEFAYAVKRVAPWAKGLKDQDVGLIVRRSLALGVDPLNPHEVQIWIDYKGNPQFKLAYTLIGEWVKHFHGQHTEPIYEGLSDAEREREGLPDGTMAWRASIIMMDDMEKLRTLLDAGFEPKLAREMVTVTGLGTASAKELSSTHFGSVGRSPAWKVQKRALEDAYRKRFGTPTRDEITELRRISGRDQIQPQDWVQVVDEGYDEADAGEAAKYIAHSRQEREYWDELAPAEREERTAQASEALYGTVEEREGDLVHNGEVVEETKPIELPDEFDDLVGRLAALNEEHGGDYAIDDGKDRFLVAKVYEKLGLGLPDWKSSMTVSTVSETLRQFTTMEKEQNDDGANNDAERNGSGDAGLEDDSGPEQDQSDPGQEPGEESA